MGCRLTAWILGGVLGCASLAVAVDQPPAGSRIGVLAEHVPVDVRLFLEIGDTSAVSDLPTGTALGDVLAWLMTQVKADAPATTKPATSRPAHRNPRPETGWRNLFAGAMGLHGAKAADLLLDGRLAIAADDWGELADAVLVAEPRHIEELETLLRNRRVRGSSQDDIRRYRLGKAHELSYANGIVVVGRRGDGNALYSRTLAILKGERALSLAELAAFRSRMAEVPADSMVVSYLGGMGRSSGKDGAQASWWPLFGPPLRSAAMGILLGKEELALEATGQMMVPTDPQISRDPPIETLLFLPASTLAAWTYPLDYVAQLRQLEAAHAQGVVRFYLRLLQWNLPPETLERDLLAHLVGDSVVIVGQVSARPRERGGDELAVRVPTLAVTVETDDPDAVERTLRDMAGNLLRLVNLQSSPEDRVTLEEEPVDEAGGTTMRSLSLGRLFARSPAREVLRTLEVSWAVSDRWLVLGTHRQTVRDMILARRGEVPLMPAEAVRQAMSRERPPRRLPDMVLVAQPELAAEMIDSWLAYIDAYHPTMRDPKWWKHLRRKYWASQVQLGILPMAGAVRGGVEVAQTLPGWPAHERLQAGDRIVAVDGTPLAQEGTLQSLRDLIAMRDRDDQVALTVVRDSKETEVEVPMPVSSSPADNVHPLVLLERVADLARRFSAASYVTWQSSRGLIQTRLQLRLADVAPKIASGQARLMAD